MIAHRDLREALNGGIGNLVGRYGLADTAREQLWRLAELLTDEHAPTSVHDPSAVRDNHLADSLVALELPEVRAAEAVADIGSGGGLPGLPLAIALPEADVSLVESNYRKCEFIARAAAACGLSNADVVRARAESWPAGRDRFDLVTARALAPLPVVAEYAAPLLRLGGSLLAWRGRRNSDEDRRARGAAAELGLEMPDAIRVDPYRGAVNRHLQLMVKTAATPERFPRRAGMARKRPLGAPPRLSSDR